MESMLAGGLHVLVDRSAPHIPLVVGGVFEGVELVVDRDLEVVHADGAVHVLRGVLAGIGQSGRLQVALLGEGPLVVVAVEPEPPRNEEPRPLDPLSDHHDELKRNDRSVGEHEVGMGLQLQDVVRTPPHVERHKGDDQLLDQCI